MSAAYLTLELREREVWSHSYVIKPLGGLNHDVCELSFSNYIWQTVFPMRFCKMFTYQWHQFPHVIIDGRLLEASGVDLRVVQL